MKYIYKIIIGLLLLLNSHLFSQTNSVLSTGQWYKISVEENGLYKLSYQDFENMGFDIASINPRTIQIYGNADGVLPEPNNIQVNQGLIENAIYVSGADDGSFDEDDFVAFYAVGPDEWVYEKNFSRFKFYGHPYDDKNFYFITVGQNEGKRIEPKNSTNQTPNRMVTDFLDYQVHELDLVNFVKSGRKWFGEAFNDFEEFQLDFDFPNLITEKRIQYGIYAAARSGVNSYIYIDPDGADRQQLLIPKLVSKYAYVSEASDRKYYTSDAENVVLNLSYSKPNASSNAWLDYLEVNATRKLKVHNHQLSFNHDILTNENTVVQFQIENAPDYTRVWEVTDPYNIKSIENINFSNNLADFRLTLNTTHYFVAFDDSGYFHPQMEGVIENQDLKGLPPFDMAIVTANFLKDEAQRLANYHIEHDNLSCVVVTKDEIFNEFSSGKQDPTAIRNFMRYHYQKNEEGEQPEYLLLFGDASYDYRDIIPDNTNIVPVYQSTGSVNLTLTFNTDDYFGILEPRGGEDSEGEIQISIGRFPVHTVEDAKIMVDKTIHYASNVSTIMGDWRNKVCFIADDEDSNLHFNDSNRLADTFLIDHPEFNVDKLFLDSYVQVTNPNGDAYPDVTDAINRKVDEGVLFFNYTGHGGHIALTDERVLQIPDITSWTNYNKLGVWIVASCEFGPFDDPSHVSAGEHLVLNPNGGGVALFTTTRLAYASYNFSLNEKFHEIAFSRKDDGAHYRMGDIIKYAKNESGNKERNLNFVLLGDPALKIAYPEFHIETTKINNQAINGNFNDTIKARQTIKVEGEVTDLNHQLISDFNGLVQVKVFGKPSIYSTLANDPKSIKANFEVIDQVIYEGEARANNGLFDFSFVVPTSISSSFGTGKISYYAIEEKGADTYYDANGGYIDFIIGGVDESIENDLAGPEINIYMDSYQFKSGDPTTNTPLMMIDLFDENGINSINLGFGKEIKANLDDDINYYLNDYYKPNDYSHKEGKIEYQLEQLSYGSHSISVKAWDMFDNVSEKNVSFLVVSPESMIISDLQNIPNPFLEETSIIFEHNQSEESQLDIIITVYDINGKQVWQYDNPVNVLGTSIEPINWNPRQDAVQNLKSGIYTYTIEISNSEGQKVKQQQKMMLVK